MIALGREFNSCGFWFLADFYGDFRLFFFEEEFFEVGFYPVAAAASLSFGFLVDAVENSWADVDADWPCSHAHISVSVNFYLFLLEANSILL